MVSGAWARFPDCAPTFFVMQIRVIFALSSPLWCPRPLVSRAAAPVGSPRPRSATVYTLHGSIVNIVNLSHGLHELNGRNFLHVPSHPILNGGVNHQTSPIPAYSSYPILSETHRLSSFHAAANSGNIVCLIKRLVLILNNAKL